MLKSDERLGMIENVKVEIPMSRADNWNRAVWRFYGFSGNIPRVPQVKDVERYHDLVRDLEDVSGHDLSRFRIPEKMNTTCELSFFEFQVIELKRFLDSIKK